MHKLILILLIVTALVTVSFTSVSQISNPHTQIFTVTADDRKAVGHVGKPGCYASDTLRCDALTQEVFDNGIVLVYVMGTNGGGWYLLPHSYYTSGDEVTTNFNYKAGYVELRTYNINNKISTPQSPLKYKIVTMIGDK